MNRQNYNPLNDYLFKFIFGREERKRITLSFLNAVLDRKESKELTDITFIDREFDPQFEEDKLSQLDIYGIASDGSQINIEVQLMNLYNMQKRTLYYWARMYQTLRKGEAYQQLSPSITINLLNFSLLPQKSPHNMYGLYDIVSGHRLTEDLEIHFLEIPKFKLKSVKEMKRLEKWLAYFSNKLNERETEELAMSEAAIKEAIQAEHIFMQSDVERWQYEQREKAMRDYLSAMTSSRDEGLQEGRREGILDMARSLLALNVPVDVIEKSSGMTRAEILALQQSVGE
ncbi:Rpn family recombination-promoting nuclease/putative transposase [Selenomonas massiliensis]|uniref:Rpn family recombination-promoting nuclease/putative transposase n=1 Tax=Selenomonas massiliensis TaxID=2058293 RepID=UPI000D10E938|nr:Rpn family recombination-promoting nuclease/putative transposase [Selenomonas massiliensis]